jgi:hypothetical protein
MTVYTGTLVYRVNHPDTTAPPENNSPYISGGDNPGVEPSIVSGLFVYTMRSRRPITPDKRERFAKTVVEHRLWQRLGKDGYTRCPERESTTQLE